MKDKLLLIISKIQHDINNRDINRGGCVHFAYYLSDILKKYGYKHKVVALNVISYWSDDDSYTFKTVMDYTEGCSHMAVYIKGIGFIDAEKIVANASKFYNKETVSMFLPPDYDLDHLRQKKFWNTSYDRSYNKTLKRIISENFKQLKYERRY